jgi:NADH:ubiquinone oxidoreductase subunit 2 (subunit N)
MYTTLQPAHSIFAYIVLTVLFLASLNAIMGIVSKKRFTDKDLRISLFAMILAHMQLLIGFILYFKSPLGSSSLGQMKDSALRLTSLEHPLINIIGLVLITIGWSKHKKEESGNGKFKKIAVFYTLGFLLILSRIPWTNWFN